MPLKIQDIKKIKPSRTSPKTLKRGDWVWVKKGGKSKVEYAVQVTDVYEELNKDGINVYGMWIMDYKWLKKLGGDGTRHTAIREEGSNSKWEYDDFITS